MTSTTETGSGTGGIAGIDWVHELAEQLDWHWTTFVRPRLDSLTDREYLWEPVPDCWSIRPRSASTTSHAAGAGDLLIEFQLPEPQPPPLTTIAWRIGHLAVGVFGVRAASHFGWRPRGLDGPLTYDTAIYPPTAREALVGLDEAYDGWCSGVRALDESGLALPCGPAEGPYAEHSLAALVLHINREALHHGAELLLLRDLYRTSDGGRRFAEGTSDHVIGRSERGHREGDAGDLARDLPARAIDEGEDLLA